MSFNVINGNALNEVRFPGAEAGLSLVEMLGTVEVTASIPALRLRLLATASATSSATCSASVKLRLGVAASVPAAAATAADALRKMPLYADPTVAQAAVAVTGRMKFSMVAAGVAQAVSAAGSYNAARRTAVMAAQAAATANARRVMPLAGSTVARADSSAGALRKVFRGASEQAVASAVASLTFRRGIGGTTTSSASGTSAARLKRLVGAPTVASATSPRAATLLYRLTYPDALVAAAVVAPINGGARITAGGAVTNATASGNASSTMRFKLSAATVAQAIATSTAEDYGLLINAPTERLMIVPASDRRMEVTL